MVLYKFSDETEISNAPLSTSLLGKLQKDILTGKLKPGQKLTEQQLCKTYGVSRTPVREALRQLETDGLVENILNRGAFVVGMTEQDYEDMFELRKAYELSLIHILLIHSGYLVKQLMPALSLCLFENIAHMALHRIFRDRKFSGYLFVAKSFVDQR